ncbi:MAG: SgcJ/EcaC family oxidoreductase [Devosiaceae bacterium]|nr:SgcJ/EcaC family oxidoreductase [Devosiaceae bacterium]
MTKAEQAQEKKGNNKMLLRVAHANFERWNTALQKGEPSGVAAIYMENATFLPTIEAIKNGRDGAERYFVQFLKRMPFGRIIEDTVQQVAENTIVHSGLYDFELGAENARSVAHARFTFVWEHIYGEWKILHHHSSVVPAKN